MHNAYLHKCIYIGLPGLGRSTEVYIWWLCVHPNRHRQLYRIPCAATPRGIITQTSVLLPKFALCHVVLAEEKDPAFDPNYPLVLCQLCNLFFYCGCKLVFNLIFKTLCFPTVDRKGVTVDTEQKTASIKPAPKQLGCRPIDYWGQTRLVAIEVPQTFFPNIPRGPSALSPTNGSSVRDHRCNTHRNWNVFCVGMHTCRRGIRCSTISFTTNYSSTTWAPAPVGVICWLIRNYWIRDYCKYLLDVHVHIYNIAFEHLSSKLSLCVSRDKGRKGLATVVTCVIISHWTLYKCVQTHPLCALFPSTTPANVISLLE